MANTNPITKDTTNNVWPYEIEISDSGWTQSHTFNTVNKFLDANISVRAHANAVGTITLDLTNNSSTAVTVGTVSNGVYPLTANMSGKITAATAGWLGTSQVNVNENGVVVGTIVQSTLANGSTTISSGATVNPTASTQTINISAGYNSARTVKIGPISAGPKATIKSGTATLGTLTYTHDATNNRFNISGTATISAATAPTAGYISNTEGVGTKQGNSNTVSQTVNKITVGTTISSGTSGKVTPVINISAPGSGDTWTNAAEGTIETTKPNSGVYVCVGAPKIDKTIGVQGTVTSTGYGTADANGTQGSYTKATAQTITAGTNAATTKYILIKSAATPSVTTTNLSGTDAVTVGTLASGYYPINVTNVTATVTMNIGTAGWYAGGDSKSSKLATSKQVGKMAQAKFTVNNNTVYCSTAGYVPKGSTSSVIGTIATGEISAVDSDPTDITNENTDLVIASGGWLKMTAGYYPAMKVSLATLVPNGSNIAGHANYLLTGYQAYDNTGALVTGGMGIYDGTYTVT